MEKADFSLIGKQVYLAIEDKSKGAKIVMGVGPLTVCGIVFTPNDFYYMFKESQQRGYPEFVCVDLKELEKKVEELKNKPDIKIAQA